MIVLGAGLNGFDDPTAPSGASKRQVPAPAGMGMTVAVEGEGARPRPPSATDYATLVDSISTLCWIADGDGWIFWYNRAWHDYTGTNAAEMEGWGWQSVHDPALLPAVMEKWQASIASGEPFEMVFPLKGADGRYRPFLTRAQPAGDVPGRPTRWFGTNTDVTMIQLNEARLRRLLDNLSGYVCVLNVDGTLLEANAMPVEFSGLRREDLIGRKLWDTDWWSGSAEGQRRLREACARARAGEIVRYDTDLTVLAGTVVTVDLQIAPMWDFDIQGGRSRASDVGGLPQAGGLSQVEGLSRVEGLSQAGAASRVTHLIVSGFDVTDRVQAQDHAQFLMQESSHRSKNLLAVVQAIAQQTARRAASLEAFQERFLQRLAGLAASQDLLVGQGWQGAILSELVRQQLTPFAEADSPRLELIGPHVMVSADAAQSIGLAMHELATNAAKHGAWSGAAGRVTVAWRFEAAGDETRRLVLCWRESDGPPVVVPKNKGFGHVVIERMVAFSLKSEVRLEFPPEGLVWTLTIPASLLMAARGG